MKNWRKRPGLAAGLMLMLIVAPLMGHAAPPLLSAGTELVYEHIHLKRQEVTGRSEFRYAKGTGDKAAFLIETNENTKPDGEVFSRKQVQLDPQSWQASYYVEEDLRKGLRIENIYTPGRIQTRLQEKDNVREFALDVPQSGMVPLETLMLYLRKNLEAFDQQQRLTFSLYLPALALELERNNLPRSMSVVQMIVEREGTQEVDSPLGRVTADRLLAYPQSAMLRLLLPKSKTHFRFLVAQPAPHWILEFEEGETRHRLTSLVVP